MPAGYGNALSPVVTMACLYQPKWVLKISMSSAILTLCQETAGVLLQQKPASPAQPRLVQTHFT